MSKKDIRKKNNHEVVRFDRAELEQSLLNYSRQPFGKILMEDCLQGAPNVEDIKNFAKKHPDRHAQACAIFGRLFGFSDKIDTVENIHYWIHNASDAELLAKNAELERQLAELGSKTVDVTPNTAQKKSNE